MTRRSNGTYQQQVTLIIDGVKVKKCFYGKTKREVTQRIAEFQTLQARGRLFRDVAEEWWREAERELAFNTTRSYKPAKERAVQRFGGTPIRQIKPSDINLFLREFIQDTNAADKTSRTQLLICNLIFRYAVSTGDIDTNPARDLTVPKGLKKEPRQMASADDIKRIKRFASCDFGLFAYMAMYTGLRHGELLALRWDDVDLQNRTISVNKSVYHVSNTPHLKAPKTEAGVRIVPIVNALLPHLQGGSGYIFPDPKTGDLMTSAHFRSLWNRYTAESGVSCTPHQLRHTFATMLFEADIGDGDAQVFLGHAQISTTRDIYTHIREGRQKQIRERLYTVDIG